MYFSLYWTIKPQLLCQFFPAPSQICPHRTTKWYMEAVRLQCTHMHTTVSSLPHTLSFTALCKLRICLLWVSISANRKIFVNKSLVYAVKCWRISQLIAIMCILDQRGDGSCLEALQRVLHVMLATQLWLRALIQSQLQSNSQRSCLHSIKKL